MNNSSIKVIVIFTATLKPNLMKKLLTIALLLGACVANGQELAKHKKPKPTQDANVLDVTKNQGTAISYKTPAEVKEEFEKEASLKMYSPEKKQEQFELLPKGGWLVLGLGRLSIEEANTKWFTVVVHNDTGKEVFREVLESRVANPVHAGSITVWQNLKHIALPEPLKTGYRVFVIDDIEKKRHEYLIQN